MVSKAIEQAQTKVEGHNFDIRKHVVQYDDVMNRHRDLIYTERRKILEGADLRANMIEMIEEEIERAFDSFMPHEGADAADYAPLLGELKSILPLPSSMNERYFAETDPEQSLEAVLEHASKTYDEKEAALGEDKMRRLERLVLLGTIDRLWVYHLTALEEMRQGIGLQGYGGKDPLVEFKREAHDMYTQLTEHIRHQAVRRIYHVTLAPQQASGAQPAAQAAAAAGSSSGDGDGNGNGPAPSGRRKGKRQPQPAVQATASSPEGAVATATAAPPVGAKVGRNDPCPCGSGKKYKKCHGAGGFV
jgi:preprotein translocase subunit SecA